VKLPNILTLCRLLGAPLFLWAFLSDSPLGRWWALALVITFEVTDLLDGYVARRFEQISQLGKILDPLADSVSRFTVFLGFLALGYANVWAIAMIFYRDSIISTVRILAASQGVIVSARWSGKLKAIVQGTAIIVILASSCLRDTLGLAEPDLLRYSNIVMWFVAGVTRLAARKLAASLAPLALLRSRRLRRLPRFARSSAAPRG
jgi:CDP-diacylglycerol--glycerol-3-phosphate 3-phosphatidyltransferase